MPTCSHWPPALFVSATVVSVPLAPLPGALNVTGVPATSTGFPSASSTTTLNATPKALPAAALCPFPASTTTAEAGPARFVSPKAVELDPVADAVTVYVPALVSAVKAVAVGTPHLCR